MFLNKCQFGGKTIARKVIAINTGAYNFVPRNRGCMGSQGIFFRLCRDGLSENRTVIKIPVLCHEQCCSSGSGLFWSDLDPAVERLDQVPDP
jgi:hypothetical protein